MIDDGMRPMSTKLREDMNNRLYDYAKKYSNKVVELSGSTENRIDVVIKNMYR